MVDPAEGGDKGLQPRTEALPGHAPWKLGQSRVRTVPADGCVHLVLGDVRLYSGGLPYLVAPQQGWIDFEVDAAAPLATLWYQPNKSADLLYGDQACVISLRFRNRTLDPWRTCPSASTFCIPLYSGSEFG